MSTAQKLFGWNKTIHLIRGIAGSGKSTLALKLMNGNRDQVVENDDYWYVPANQSSPGRMYGPNDAYIVTRGDPPFDFVEVFPGQVYRYEAEMTHLAGAWCGAEAFRRLRLFPEIAVANTFILRKHIFLYVEEAQRLGVRIKLHEPKAPWNGELYGHYANNIHSVPMDVIERMKSQWEHVTQEQIDVLLGVPE